MAEGAKTSKESSKQSHPFRVIAGFGSIADELPTIEAAMMLARALEAEIAGCFIEDVDLLNLAALPFAKAIRPADRSVLQIEREQMERELARAATSCQRTLYARSSHTSVRCSFKIMRGAYSAEIAKEAVASDLVVINPLNLPLRPPNAISMLWQTIDEAMGTVIMPEHGHWRADGPVVVLHSGTHVDQSILGIAVRVARATGTETVLLAVDDLEDDRPKKRKRKTGPPVPGSGVRIIQARNLQTAAVHLSDLQPSLVVLQPSEPLLGDAAIALLLKASQAPLMLLRRG